MRPESENARLGAGGSRGEKEGVWGQEGFPGGSCGEETACNTGDMGFIPGLGRSPGGGHGKLL